MTVTPSMVPFGAKAEPELWSETPKPGDLGNWDCQDNISNSVVDPGCVEALPGLIRCRLALIPLFALQRYLWDHQGDQEPRKRTWVLGPLVERGSDTHMLPPTSCMYCTASHRHTSVSATYPCPSDRTITRSHRTYFHLPSVTSVAGSFGYRLTGRHPYGFALETGCTMRGRRDREGHIADNRWREAPKSVQKGRLHVNE